MKKIIFVLFATLLFFVPIVLWPFTSEVFEFNKMVLVYVLTTLIFGAWLTRCIIERRIIFRRTILDIPLLAFLGSQIISTLLSIDFYTSMFGYYSRFNGGLLSTVCYLILYWAFVSNFDQKETLKLIKIWLTVGVIISAIGIGEHFSFFVVCPPIQYYSVHNSNASASLVAKYAKFNTSQKFKYLFRTSCWVQDVQSRVFATLGQPNWLAAWITAFIPILWALAAKKSFRDKRFWIYFGLSGLFFWTLIFTKSRSGFLGFGVTTIIFWGLIFWKNIKKPKPFILPFLIAGIISVAICLISGTQWTPSIGQFLSHKKVVQVVDTGVTSLETGGTDSGTIRKIVWTGAIKLWEHYPVFGTGVETFGYSYYLYRPATHNLTSEWNFIYNKAHNEFLNFAANSGTVGLVTYLIVIGFSIFIFLNLKNQNSKSAKNLDLQFIFELYNLRFALLAGFVSLSVSNFFGFSVVPTQLQFFLFPAFAICLMVYNEKLPKIQSLNNIQKTSIAGISVLALYFLFLISHYWYADILYSKGKNENSLNRPDLAYPVLSEAINLEPAQAIYYGELSASYSTIAMAYDQAKEATASSEFVNLAANEIQKAVDIAPANVILRQQMFGVYVRLSTINENYLTLARSNLLDTIKMAPTDPKLYYYLGIADANLGQNNQALQDFKKAIELKADYSDARVEYAALLVEMNQKTEAKSQLEYVLTKIDPNNSTAKEALDNIK